MVLSCNRAYGSGPVLTRLAGRGNGGNVLEFTKETIEEILKNGVAKEATYVAGAGPVKIKVVDPIKVPNAKFEFVLRENKASLASGLKDSMTKNTGWFMVKKGATDLDNDTIFNDTIIGVGFESVQGRRGKYNKTTETLADWGFSVEVEQVFNPGENANADPSNGVLSWSVNWENNGKQWLTAVADNDAQNTANSGAIWQNWIRAGSNGRGGPFDPLIHDFFNQDGSPLDPGQAFERIWNGRIAPYGLTAREKLTAAGRNTYGFAWWGNSSGLQSPLSEVASVQIVITKDKNLWTRCPVLEMSDDELKNSNEGQMEKFNMRFAPSVDKEGNPIAGSMGLGWFPGYAINMETGERLAMAFSEDTIWVVRMEGI